MAKKNHYPVQRKMRLAELSPQSNNATMLIDTMSELSKVNHRLYRQSRVPMVKVEIDADLPTGSIVDVYALSDTWMNMKAYQMAKETYDANSAEERAYLSKTNVGRWNDFRVKPGISAATMNAVVEGDGSSTILTSGDFSSSEVTDASGVTHTFRWIGSSVTEFNIIDEYDRTGDTQQTPTFGQGTAAYADLDDQLDSDQVEHLSEAGSEAPYDDRTIENDCLTRVARLYVDAEGQGKLSTAYFNAPCGFVILEGQGGITSITLSNSVSIEVRGGDYKGVLAPSYLPTRKKVFASNSKMPNASHNVRIR